MLGRRRHRRPGSLLLVLILLVFILSLLSPSPTAPTHEFILAAVPLPNEPIASSAPSPRVAPTPTSITQLISYVASKHILIIQTDNRLPDLALSTPSGSFSLNPAAPSILDLSTWASLHNYSYLFVPSPPTCYSFDGTKVLTSYWFKIPALLYVLHLARVALPSIKAIVLLDTDLGTIIPSAHTREYTVEDVLSATNSSHHIVFSADPFSHWVQLLWRGGVYSRGGINSGALLVRPTPEAEAMLLDLWTNKTREPSPYERTRNETVLRVKAYCDNCAKLTPKNVDWKRVPIAFGLARSLNHSLLPFAVPTFKSSSLVPPDGFEFALALSPMSGSATEAARIQTLCCAARGSCARLISQALLIRASKDNSRNFSLTSVSFSCAQGSALSTLYAWPGDQDRLNWLYDSSPHTTTTTPIPLALSIAPHVYSPMVFFHWAEDPGVKRAMAMRTANQSRLHFGAPNWTLWDTGGLAWQALQTTVAVLHVPPHRLTSQAFAALERGEFNLSLPGTPQQRPRAA